MCFKDEYVKQFDRLRRKYQLTTIEAISQSQTMLAYLIEFAPSQQSDIEEIERLKAERLQRKKEVALKWRKRNREMLSDYAKQYRIAYLGQRKDA